MENDKFSKFKESQKKFGRFKKNNNLNDKMESFVFKNMKAISLATVELMNNVLFHYLDTIKVRLQAKAIKDDTS